jgi:hypothetical protein
MKAKDEVTDFEESLKEIREPWNPILECIRFVRTTYKIKKLHNERLYIVGEGGSTQYNAFKVNVLDPITGIDCENYDSIIDFCKKYGLPNGQNTQDNPDKQELEQFISDVKELKACRELYDKFKIHSEDEVTEDLRIQYAMSTLLSETSLGDDFDYDNDTSNYLKMVPWAIVGKINEKLKRLRVVLFYKDGNFIPGPLTSDLITVAYFQLHKKVTAGEISRVCINCGKSFFPTHGSQKYCPDPPDYKGRHSRCENLYNHRNKQKV